MFIHACHLEKLKETIEEKRKVQGVCNTKIKDLEANLADAKGYRDRQLKEAKDHMQKMKDKSEKSRKEWEKHEKVYKLDYWIINYYECRNSYSNCLELQSAETLRLEVEGLKESIEKANEEMGTTETHIQELQQKVCFENNYII